jgi:hypothetical protein
MAIFGATANNNLTQLGTVTVSFSGGEGSTAMFINTTIAFSRQIGPVATLNKGVMLVAQPPMGTLQADAILTADDNLATALEDGCSPQTCTISPTNEACSLRGKTITASGLFFSGITFTAAAQQGYIAEQVTGNFTQLDVS